jgi:hypothetical protein
MPATRQREVTANPSSNREDGMVWWCQEDGFACRVFCRIFLQEFRSKSFSNNRGKESNTRSQKLLFLVSLPMT